MPYAPTVNDRSGEILGSAIAGAGRLRAEGQMALGQGIGSGLGSIGSGFEKYFEQAQQNREEGQYLDAKWEMMANVPGSDGRPLMDAQSFEKYSKASLGAKRAMVSTAEVAFDRYFKTLDAKEESITDLSYMGANKLLVNGRVVDKEDAPFTPDEATIEQMRKAGYGWAAQSRTGGSWVPLQTTMPTPAQVTPQQDAAMTAAGYIMDPSTNKYVPNRSAQKSGGLDYTNAADPIASLRKDIAALDREIVLRGEDATVSWFGPTLKKRREALEAELKSLLEGTSPLPATAVQAGAGTSGSQQAPVGTPSAAAPGYQIGKPYRLRSGGTAVYLGGDPNNPTSWR